MAKKVRVYYSACIDIELNENDFSSEEEMIEFAENNASDYLNAKDICDSLSKQDGQSEIIDF